MSLAKINDFENYENQIFDYCDSFDIEDVTRSVLIYHLLISTDIYFDNIVPYHRFESGRITQKNVAIYIVVNRFVRPDISDVENTVTNIDNAELASSKIKDATCENINTIAKLFVPYELVLIQLKKEVLKKSLKPLNAKFNFPVDLYGLVQEYCL